MVGENIARVLVSGTYVHVTKSESYSLMFQIFCVLLALFLVYVTTVNLIGPVYYCLVFHVAGLILFVCKYTSSRNGYTQLGIEKSRNAVCKWLNFIATLWHGHEVIGLEEKIPASPCVFVFYHESTIIDLLYFWIKYHQEYPTRNLHIIGGCRILGNLFCPGWARLSEVLNISSATCADCVDLLSEGNDLCILPGGSNLYRERDNYQVNWGSRIGFALIAAKAKVPIIPVFTKNIQEAFHIPNFYKTICNAAMVLPVVQVISGGLPVKLKTYIGDIIHCNNSSTPFELADKTAEGLRRCIEEHQTRPASKFSALGERFSCCCKCKSKKGKKSFGIQDV